MGRKLFSFFITGLVLILPLCLTIYVMYKMVVAVDALFPLTFPGLGLMIVIGMVTMIGALASLIVGQPIAKRIEQLFLKTPIFGFIYKAFKDLAQAFVGKENKFSEPVIIKIAGDAVFRIGFVTSREGKQLLEDHLQQQDLIAVYVPLSYSLSGDLFLVEAANVRPLNISARDAMQYIISGGVINPKTDIIKPSKL